jgi:hypothetical protein
VLQVLQVTALLHLCLRVHSPLQLLAHSLGWLQRELPLFLLLLLVVVLLVEAQVVVAQGAPVRL